MTTIYLILGAVALGSVGLWLLIRSARSQGRAEAASEAQRRTIENANKRAKTDDEIAKISDPERRARLAEWVSDDE
jgi:hypothetical protein